MKFIFADSLDLVDPRYDFVADRSPEGREPYWDDVYPHEILGHAPYDGMLVSRAIVGDHLRAGKYSESQAMRFRLVGAREFLRLNERRFPGKLLFGDCGAFSYHRVKEPPYTAEDTVEFYEDGRFTHGCSVDHVIFDFEPEGAGLEGGTTDAHQRFEITLQKATEFLDASKRLGSHFTPVGVVQGWSPGSMAVAAERLVKMGYEYLAVGGMVPLKAEAIHKCLAAIRDRIRPDIKLHLLGFAKADQIHEFVQYRIESFDSTSPLIRAFKDSKSNYYLPTQDGSLKYYAAIRIPQSTQNNALNQLSKSGYYRQEDLVALEFNALDRIRRYDRDEVGLDETLDAVMAYSRPLLCDHGPNRNEDRNEQRVDVFRQRYRRTLEDRPWKDCDCAICAALSVEVVIFRSSNRNKRRGIHNLGVFYEHIKSIREGGRGVIVDLHRHQSAAD